MPETTIAKHFKDKKFHTIQNPIFMKKCFDEKCELKGDFSDYIILNYDNIVKILKKHEKSVDRIVFAKKVENKKITVMLCELTTSKKKYRDVLEKMKKSGEYIVKLFAKYGFTVINFDCIYLEDMKKKKDLEKPTDFQFLDVLEMI